MAFGSTIQTRLFSTPLIRLKTSVITSLSRNRSCPRREREMVVLHFTPIPQTVLPPLSSSRLASTVTSSSFSRVHKKSVHLQTELSNGLKIQGRYVLKQRGAIISKATSDIDGAGTPESTTPPSEAVDESLSVEELPLESKLQLKLDQKAKMKLAKKIRLRRKRLVRKRQLRKKGRWPPSKMKKNKNV